MTRISARVRGFVVVGLLACSASIGVGQPADALVSCGTPNYYAGGLGQTNGDQWGGRAYIDTDTNLSFSHTNDNFSDQAIHAVDGNGGLEIGWYVGWGSETGTYVTAPHAYATLNGPQEIDGPNVGASDYLYTTHWNDARTQQIWSVKTFDGGTFVWSGSQATSTYTGPGEIVALGEVDASSLPMFGKFDGDPNTLDYYNISDNWVDWTGVTLCASPGFTVSGGRNTITDSGNL